uniref:Uncharacterized protein n=1 Tax=Salix viminalis TaxID=40686 RepID=A0A6N2MNK6_SALVM
MMNSSSCLRKVMKTVFFNGEIKFDMSQEECARFILDHLVALARADAWFLINCCSGTYHFVENCTSNMLDPYLDEIISKLLRCYSKETTIETVGLISISSDSKSSRQVSRVLQNSYALPKFCDDESKRGI